MEEIIITGFSQILTKEGEIEALLVQTNKGSYIYNDKTEEII